MSVVELLPEESSRFGAGRVSNIRSHTVRHWKGEIIIASTGAWKPFALVNCEGVQRELYLPFGGTEPPYVHCACDINNSPVEFLTSKQRISLSVNYSHYSIVSHFLSDDIVKYHGSGDP